MRHALLSKLAAGICSNLLKTCPKHDSMDTNLSRGKDATASSGLSRNHMPTGSLPATPQNAPWGGEVLVYLVNIPILNNPFIILSTR